jgi:hypothetical protein
MLAPCDVDEDGFPLPIWVFKFGGRADIHHHEVARAGFQGGACGIWRDELDASTNIRISSGATCLPSIHHGMQTPCHEWTCWMLHLSLSPSSQIWILCLRALKAEETMIHERRYSVKQYSLSSKYCSRDTIMYGIKSLFPRGAVAIDLIYPSVSARMKIGWSQPLPLDATDAQREKILYS